ncbi:hypothetical protein HYV11_01085 [Candidatus Dependentiae bacterium]|nr:hypothetical protein [Candidatus Dependentiae bacterium]
MYSLLFLFVFLLNQDFGKDIKNDHNFFVASNCDFANQKQFPIQKVAFSVGESVKRFQKLEQMVIKNKITKKELKDGRIRYKTLETSARTFGPTRGASYVTEYNPFTKQLTSWYESYGHSGEIIRVHPKMKNGDLVEKPHYPKTGKEIKKQEQRIV